MAKINTKNVVLVLGMTVFDLGVGLYDRLVNGIGVIDSLLKFAAAQSQSAAVTFSKTDITMAMTNTGSAFNFMALGLFVIAAVIIIGLVAGVMGKSAGMM